MEEELQLKYVSLLQSMIRASREYQYSEILRQTPEKFPFYPAETLAKPKTVFYQGVPGAYQELAARALFPSCEPQNVPTWEQGFPVRPRRQGRYRRCAGREHNRRHGQRSL